MLFGCAGSQQFFQSPKGSALLSTSETIANVVLSAAATTYGGPVAGQLASAGLNALGTVLQGYINKPIPPAIVKASPGIAPVGKAVMPLISPTKPVTQADVNTIFEAAKLVKTRK